MYYECIGRLGVNGVGAGCKVQGVVIQKDYIARHQSQVWVAAIILGGSGGPSK